MTKSTATPVTQEWALRLSFMQQTVLLTAIRAPDGVAKNHPVKVLMRWYRRCLLVSAFDGKALLDPTAAGGGSFTGPFTWEHAKLVSPNACAVDYMDAHHDLLTYFAGMRNVYLDHVDELPHHFQLHFMHGAQIMGVHHSEQWIREWWRRFYEMIVNDAHLSPESDDEMNLRLSDNELAWRSREEAPAK